MVFVYNLLNNTVSKYYSDSDLKGLAIDGRGELVVIKDGKLHTFTGDGKVDKDVIVETGFIELKTKSRTIEAIIDRYPLHSAVIEITNEKNQKATYRVDRNAFILKLGKGFTARYLKWKMVYTDSMQLNSIKLVLEEVV